MILKGKYKRGRIGWQSKQVSIGLLVRRSKREIRALYYRDEEKDMREERNCNTTHHICKRQLGCFAAHLYLRLNEVS